MHESLLQAADAGNSLSDSGSRRLSIRQRMQQTLSDSRCRRLYQTADAGDSPSGDAGVFLSVSGCRSLCIRQRMQGTLYQTADAGDSFRQRMQETLLQTADAGVSPGVSLLDSGC